MESITSIITGVVTNQFFIKYGLVGLFLNGLFSSIIPIPTEFTVSALLLGGYDRMIIFLVLLASSVAGGFVAYYVGYTGGRVFRWMYKKPNKKYEERADALIRKYGWSALFICPWIPVLGDVIPTLAGAKRLDFKKYAVVMTAGKTVKVIAIVYVLAWVVPLIFNH